MTAPKPTPEERANDIVLKWYGMPGLGSELRAAIAASIRAAVEEERRACAEVARERASGILDLDTEDVHAQANEIADAIEARGTK